MTSIVKHVHGSAANTVSEVLSGSHIVVAFLES